LLAGKVGLGAAIVLLSLGTDGVTIIPGPVPPESLGRSSLSL
jgi:hypothetical protein